ncbi:MAG: ribosomal L7Ae/L30e/S12e/Gadd45 family protein [Candidatus Geothermarchaeales archaeon]
MSSQDALLRDIESSLRVIAKTGRIVFGARNVEWALRGRRVKVILTARNAPPPIEARVEAIAKAKKVPTFKSSRSSIELGEACGRPHFISTLAILDFGGAPVGQRLK